MNAFAAWSPGLAADGAAGGRRGRVSFPPMTIYSLGTFALLCVTSLLAIINPLTTTPLYLSLTEGYTAEHRQRTLRHRHSPALRPRSHQRGGKGVHPPVGKAFLPVP